MPDPFKAANQEPIDHHTCPSQGVLELEQAPSERKRRKEALRKETEKYHLLMEYSPTAISVAQDGRHKFVNRRALEMLGYSEEELTASPFIEFVHPDDREMVMDRYRKRLSNKDVPDVYALRVIDKSGSAKWIEIQATLVTWDGKPATLNFFTDITDRKKTEEALQASELQYHTIFETTGTTMLMVEDDMTIFLANRGFESLTGYSPEEVEGKKKWTEFVEKDDLEKMMRRHQLRRDNPDFAEKVYEFRLIRKDGHQRDILLTVDVIPGTRRSVASLIDLTERKKAEEELRISEEKYRGILDSIDEGYFEVDLAGNFIFANDAECKILGCSRSELLGTNYRRHRDGMDAKKEYRIFNQLYRTGDPIKALEGKYIRKDGTAGFNEISVSLMRDAEGKPIGFRGLARDITERKRSDDARRRLEERLQRAEKMEALGTLAGGVAHDLNNVLGAVIGYAELLLTTMEASSPHRNRLMSIMKGGEKATAIVQDLLTLARRGVPVRDVLNLNKIIVDYQQSPEFEKLYSYHPSVQIKSDLQPDLMNITGSSIHLGKSLFNLVSNATEAMPEGGLVTIMTANQYLDRPIHGYDDIREGEYVVLTVSDTGEGISKGDLKHIFEPFYTKKIMGRSGTGLGLAVVWGTVKDHDGYINVRSEVGKGSVFTLYFPATREEIADKDATVSLSAYMGNDESILVVDDVREQRELAAEMLKILRYNVTMAASGEDAVTYIKDHPVDLMVLDMIMDPGMDGLDTYRNVLKIRPKQKAVIVSGFSETDRVKAAQALGAGAYVRKPYVLETIGLAIKKELERTVKQSAAVQSDRQYPPSKEE